MIDSRKIIEISKLSGMRPWQQEKHYPQSLILTIISDFHVIFNGETYLWFFHGLNRFSEDLDFTANVPMRPELPEIVHRSLSIYGFENEAKIIKNDSLGLSIRYMINGPLHTGEKDRCVIYIEISKMERTMLPNLSLSLDLAQYDIPVKNLIGMNLDEVGSERVRAILTREKGRDIYDLYFLIHRKAIRFNLELINNKLSYYNIKFDSTEFMQELLSRKSIYLKEVKPIILGTLPDYDDVIATIDGWSSHPG